MVKKEDLSPWFCTAPWTHTFISPQSERRLCCASREQATWQQQYIDQKVIPLKQEYSPPTLEEHWNSPKMMDIRKRILAGENIPECAVCNEGLLNIYTYKSYFTQTLFPDKIDSILENTAEDGSTTLKPISFDYRVSNLCNFKCRMCGEQLSSAWESEKRIHNLHNKQQWMLDENKVKIEKFQTEVVEQELWDAAREGRLEEIYWVGGEPLMYQIHWDLMDYLVKTDQAKNVTVRYNTNLSKVTRGGVNLYDILPKFKRVNVCASMDGTGDIAEYIRTGLKWDEWLENFKAGMFLNKQFGMDAMVIDVTITLPGLFSMKSLMDLAVELNSKSYVKVCFDFDPSSVMSPMCLPRDLLDEVLDDLIAYEISLNSPLTKIYRETFENMKNERKTFDVKFSNWKEGIAGGKRFHAKLEQIRPNTKTSMAQILSGHPKILEWWNNG
jgi:hypothetical protein